MNDGLQRKQLLSIFKILFWYLTRGVEENHRNLNQYSWTPSQYINLRPSICKTGVLIATFGGYVSVAIAVNNVST
jgi:hypothetical protein